MGASREPKSKSPLMMVDEMVGYQYASKSHVIITMMFLIITSCKFISLPMDILNLSHHAPCGSSVCLINKFVKSLLFPSPTIASQNVKFSPNNYLTSLIKIATTKPKLDIHDYDKYD
jgi:hypothetical protein